MFPLPITLFIAVSFLSTQSFLVYGSFRHQFVLTVFLILCLSSASFIVALLHLLLFLSVVLCSSHPSSPSSWSPPQAAVLTVCRFLSLSLSHPLALAFSLLLSPLILPRPPSLSLTLSPSLTLPCPPSLTLLVLVDVKLASVENLLRQKAKSSSVTLWECCRRGMPCRGGE